MHYKPFDKQKLFEYFIQNSNGFIYEGILNEKISFTTVSNTCIEITGYNNVELLNQSIDIYSSLILSKFKNERLIKFIENQKSKTDFTIEYQIISKHGKIKWVKEYVSFKPDGIGLEAFIQDITSSKSNNNLSNEFASFQNAVNSGSIVSITDKNGIIIYVNDLFCLVSKYSRIELIGKSHAIVNSGQHDKTFFTELWRTILKGETWRGQIRNKDKKGAYYWVDTVITPILNDSGQIEQFLSIRNVITEQKEFEYALIESEALNKSALSTLKANIAVSDYDGNIIKTNKNWDDFSKRNGEKNLIKTGVGANYFKVLDNSLNLDDGTSSKIKLGIAEVIKQKIPFFEIEYPCHSDQKERWFLLHISKFEKNIDRILYCHYDITQKILQEKSNRNNQARLLEAQRLAKIGSWELDILKNKLYWSDECYRIFESKKIGTEVTYETFLNIVHPEDRNYVDASYYESIKNKKPYCIEHRLLFKNGKVKYVQEQCETFYNASGMPIRSIGTTQDISKQKESEVLLEDQNIRYKNVIENISDGLIIDDVKGKILFANQQFLDLIGIDNDELKRFNFYKYVSDEFKASIKKRHQLRMKGELVSEIFEYIGLKKDGSKRWFEARVSKITKDGKIIGTQSAIRDITDAKNSIELLKSSEAEKTHLLRELNNRYNELMQFNYIVSHNLRSPIANLIGLCDLFLDEELNQEEIKKIISHILNSVNKLDELISDLNIILSAQSNINTKKEIVNIPELIDKVTSTLSDQIVKNKINIEVIVSDEAKELKSIKSFLRSSIYNLVNNAIKYRSNENPTIKIEINREDENLKIEISDNGIGIDLAKYGKDIFGFYKRFHPTFEGKGLGLHMTKTQIESLGGLIKIQSKPGIGSTFTILLPITS